MSSLLSLTDLNTRINHEPRIQDVLLANKLGYERPNEMKRLIERNRPELETYGQVCVTVTQTPSSAGGRPGKTYYLNEGQALVLCALSRTPKAAAVRKSVIEVFMAWRRGQLPTTKPVQQKLPLQHKPINAKEVQELCDEILTVLGHFQIMNQQSQASRAKQKVQKLLLDTAHQATKGIVNQVIFHA